MKERKYMYKIQIKEDFFFELFEKEPNQMVETQIKT